MVGICLNIINDESDTNVFGVRRISKGTNMSRLPCFLLGGTLSRDGSFSFLFSRTPSPVIDEERVYECDKKSCKQS